MGCSSSKELLVEMKQFHEKYALGQVIGKGAFATVRLCLCKETNEEYAVKVLDMRGSDGSDKSSRPSTERLRQELRAEQRAWSQVAKHNNCVFLAESFIDNYFGYFVMERCHGTLLEGLRSETELNEYTYAHYFQEMAVSLAHIHALGVIHRDIKQDNFLLGGPEGRTIKLCDFGLSAVPTGEGPVKLTGVYGTSPYMAPEMVLPHGTHGEPCDIWSLGVIIYTAFYGCFPYMPKEKNSEAMKQVVRGGVPAPAFVPNKKFRQEAVSDVATTFAKALLERNPASRPPAVKLLKMDYLVNNHVHEQQAKVRGLKDISLQPMLHGAVRAGAFGTRAPQGDPNAESLLMELQNRANARLSAKSQLQRGTSPATPTEGLSDEDSGRGRRPNGSSKGLPPKQAWDSGSTKAGSSQQHSDSQQGSVAL